MNQTQVFKSYSDFLKRVDKTVNGVSEDFAKKNTDYLENNNTNKGCWNCKGCSDCFDCKGCFDCKDCSDCKGCSDCSGCFACVDLENKESNLKDLKVPVIENIHQKVFEAIQKEDALNMSKVHTCSTTHCRAGWVVDLAGEEGYKLEEKTNWSFAAMQIYKASSDIKVSPVRFFEGNSEAIKDIKRCALEEQNY